MTKYKFPSILTSMLCFLLISACERIEQLQSTTSNDIQKQILSRSDCNECPGNDECCCVVSLESYDQQASLRFCGTSDGSGLCSGDDDCGSVFSGGWQEINLHYINNPGQIFCMGEDSPFWVQNYHVSDVANIIITCQNDHTAPQFVHIRLLPGEKFYFETDAACEIATCAG